MSSNRAIPAKLFIGILKVKDLHLKEQLEERLTSDFGPSDHRMILVPSDGTIHRVFFSFDRLVATEDLPKIRELSRSIDQEFSSTMLVGFVDNRRVALIPASESGQAEEMIRFKDGGIQVVPGAHPDFMTDTSQKFFLSMRKTFRAQLRSMCLLRR
jgi:hypothetical protein